MNTKKNLKPRKDSNSTNVLNPEKTLFKKQKEVEFKDFVNFREPCHQYHISLLSSKSGFGNYRGFLNLAFMLTFMSNIRLVVENLLKYGLLFNPLTVIGRYTGDVEHFPTVSLFLSQPIFILISYSIEKLASSSKRNQSKSLFSCQEYTWISLHSINIFFQLGIPCYVVLYYIRNNAIGAMLTIGTCVIVFLKLISYAAVNHWARIYEMTHRKKADAVEIYNGLGSKISYPHNITLSDIIYFTFAPTLCYELNFPRSPYIRIRFLLRRLGETLFLSVLLFALSQQWIIPTVMNSVEPMQNMDWSRMIERLLKLAVPNLVLWLIFFYAYFHCFLNFLGELLRFGDREFYSDWWNSTTITYFWKNWNIPVHKWAKRHLFVPLVARGYTKFTATLAVFLFSAIFHELLVSLPLHMFKIWSFSAMMAQIPLAFLTERYFKDSQYGNMIVWCSIVFGQPVAILMYTHDYILEHSHAEGF